MIHNDCVRGVSVMALTLLAGMAMADGPKAYVITGWNVNANDKAWHDRIAEEAKRDLEAAGYKVVQITEATKAQFKDAVQDPQAKGLVFIDHGTQGQNRVRLKDQDGEPSRATSQQFGGPFPNFDVMTIHACDQNTQKWRDLFPNADFHSWDGCIFPSDELRWQQKKQYAPAGAPQADNTSFGISPQLREGQFVTGAEDAYPLQPLGHWPMDPLLAGLFGNRTFTLIIEDQFPPQTNVLFSARIENGSIVQNWPAEGSPDADFLVIFRGDFWDIARQVPEVTLNVELEAPGSPVTIIPNFPAPPEVREWLYAGVRRTLFGMPPGGPECPPCAADFNQDGGVDGSDVEAFFNEWENGLGCADVNLDGGIDGADVEFFFAVWQEGGC